MNEHDIRPIGRSQGLCVRCARAYPQPLPPDLSICRGPVHASPQPLCGAPMEAPSASALIPENRAVTCRDCLEIAARRPAGGGRHDLRIWDGGLACARCGQWGAEHLAFSSCAEGTERPGGLCAPSRFPDQAPDGIRGNFAREERFARSLSALCGGERSPIGLASAMASLPAGRTRCGECRARFGLLPPLPPAVHDVRLPAAGGAACASCGIVAAGAEQLGAECDGGRALGAIRERRAGRSRAWLPHGYASRPRHAEGGCAAARAGSPGGVLRIRRGVLTHRHREAIRARITCIPCVRALARAPALPA